MGCVVQPGGESGQIRVRYTARRKYGLVTAARHMRAEGKLLQGTAGELNVSALLLSRWEVQKVGKMDPCDRLFKSKKRATHAGPLSQLEVLEEPLLHYIFEMCKQGVIVNMWGVTLRASYLLPKFREKLFTAQCGEALACGPFDEVSNRHTHRAASPGQSQGQSLQLHGVHAPHRPCQQPRPAFHPQHGSNAGLFFDERQAYA